MCTVAKYFTGHRPSEEMDISYDKKGWEIEPVSVEVEDILGDLKKILDELGDSRIYHYSVLRKLLPGYFAR